MRPPAGGQRYLILHAWLLQHRPRAQPSPRCDPGCCTTRRNRCQEESVAACPRHSREAGSCTLGPDRKKTKLLGPPPTRLLSSPISAAHRAHCDQYESARRHRCEGHGPAGVLCRRKIRTLFVVFSRNWPHSPHPPQIASPSQQPCSRPEPAESRDQFSSVQSLSLATPWTAACQVPLVHHQLREFTETHVH